MKTVFKSDDKGIYLDQGGEHFYVPKEVMRSHFLQTHQKVDTLANENVKLKKMLNAHIARTDGGQLKKAIDQIKSIVKDI